jgi:hypothetical protein
MGGYRVTTWRSVLVEQHEWTADIEYAGRSAVSGLDAGWQRVTSQPA